MLRRQRHRPDEKYDVNAVRLTPKQLCDSTRGLDAAANLQLADAANVL